MVLKQTKIIMILCVMLLLGYEGCIKKEPRHKLNNSIVGKNVDSTKSKFKLNILCNAYEKNSIEQLRKFFNMWHKEITPLSKNEKAKLNDQDKIVYKIFEDYTDYYLTSNLNLFNKKQYIMLQNEIDYFLYDSKNTSVKHIIYNFTPLPNNIDSSKIVFVSPTYKVTIKSFIETKCESRYESKYKKKPWPGWPKANFLERITHLNASLLSFHIYTAPYVSIRINPKKRESVIEWKLGFASGADLFCFVNNKWIFKEGLSRSIE